MDTTKVEVTRLPVSLSFMQFDVAPSFPRKLARENFDVVHSHGYRDYLSTVSFAVARAKRRPFVLQPHGALYAYQRILPRNRWRAYRLYDLGTWRRIATQANAVVVSTTEEEKDAIRFGVQRSKIKVIPPGASVTPEHRKPDSDHLRILFVGRIAPSRKVDDILRAFSLAVHREPMHLTVVGGEEKLSSSERGGYYQYLARLASELGIKERVTFAGPLYGENLAEAYESADIFVYASSYESFGQTILEAASYGLPILSTAVGVARDLVDPGKTGEFFERGNITQLADHMVGLAGDRAKLRNQGASLRGIVNLRYGWDKIVREYLSLYLALEREIGP
jgi:glycosyltransferase involved in cell wall biosynthesis